MTTKTITLIASICFCLSATAQVPADSWIYGTWANQGYAYEGSFYPSNYWNGETITFKMDYTYERTKSGIRANRIDTLMLYGKWSLSVENEKLRFYEGGRFLSQGEVAMFDSESEVIYFSDSYFEISEMKGNHKVRVRYQKAGTVLSFEENILAQQAKKSAFKVTYDTVSPVFYMVNSLDPSRKKKLYFDTYIFDAGYAEKVTDPALSAKSGGFKDASIADFTDTTILFSYSGEWVQLDYKDNSIMTTNNYLYSPNDDFNLLEKQLPLVNITSLQMDRYGTAHIPGIVAVLSGVTALIVAPLVSIHYKNGDFNKNRYYRVAAIGLIGAGISIPLAFILKPKKVNIIPPNGAGAKNNWYLQKSTL